MKKFYVSSVQHTNGKGRSTVNFYEQKLKDLQYIFVDSEAEMSEVMSAIASRDLVLLDIGHSKKREWELMQVMIRAKYQHITITLQDIDFSGYGRFMWKSKIAATIWRWYHSITGNYGAVQKFLKKIEYIYVHSAADRRLLETCLHLNNVRLITEL